MSKCELLAKRDEQAAEKKQKKDEAELRKAEKEAEKMQKEAEKEAKKEEMEAKKEEKEEKKRERELKKEEKEAKKAEPKKPLSCYMLWSNDRRQRLLEEQPELKSKVTHSKLKPQAVGGFEPRGDNSHRGHARRSLEPPIPGPTRIRRRPRSFSSIVCALNGAGAAGTGKSWEQWGEPGRVVYAVSGQRQQLIKMAELLAEEASSPAPSHPIHIRYPFPADPVSPYPHPNPYHAIPCRPIPSHPIPSLQLHPIPSHPIPSHPSHSTLSHPSPSQSILAAPSRPARPSAPRSPNSSGKSGRRRVRRSRRSGGPRRWRTLSATTPRCAAC